VADRQEVLRATVTEHILLALRKPERDGIWRMRCATIMPDHIHCLIELGSVHPHSRALGRFKALTKTMLAGENTSWPENFYDHRLRLDESAEAVIRYIYLNPYHAGLVQPAESWPWFYCCAEDWTWFSGLTGSGRPFPEWLR